MVTLYESISPLGRPSPAPPARVDGGFQRKPIFSLKVGWLGTDDPDDAFTFYSKLSSVSSYNYRSSPHGKKGEKATPFEKSYIAFKDEIAFWQITSLLTLCCCWHVTLSLLLLSRPFHPPLRRRKQPYPFSIRGGSLRQAS